MPLPPARVFMASHEWRIEAVDRDDKRLDGAEGITVYDDTTIFYDITRPARQRFDTLWHELTHALNHSFGLDLKSRSARKNDERVATVHGLAWTQTLITNPRLVEWLSLATAYLKSQENDQA